MSQETAKGIISSGSGMSIVLGDKGTIKRTDSSEATKRIHKDIEGRVKRRRDEGDLPFEMHYADGSGGEGVIYSSEMPAASRSLDMEEYYRQLGAGNPADALATLRDLNQEILELASAGLEPELLDKWQQAEILWNAVGDNGYRGMLREARESAERKGDDTVWSFYREADLDQVRRRLAGEGINIAALNSKAGASFWSSRLNMDPTHAEITAGTMAGRANPAEDYRATALSFVKDHDDVVQQERTYNNAKSVMSFVNSTFGETDDEFTPRQQATVARAAMRLVESHRDHQPTTALGVFEALYQAQEHGDDDNVSERIARTKRLSDVVLDGTEDAGAVRDIVSGLDIGMLSMSDGRMGVVLGKAAAEYGNAARHVASLGRTSNSNITKAHLLALARGNNGLLDTDSEEYQEAAQWKDRMTAQYEGGDAASALLRATGNGERSVSAEVVPALVEAGKVAKEEVGTATRHLETLADTPRIARSRKVLLEPVGQLNPDTYNARSDELVSGYDTVLGKLATAAEDAERHEAPDFNFLDDEALVAHIAGDLAEDNDNPDVVAGAARERLNKFKGNFTRFWGSRPSDIGTQMALRGKAGLHKFTAFISGSSDPAANAYRKTEVLGVPLNRIMTRDEFDGMDARIPQADGGVVFTTPAKRQDLLERYMRRAYAYGIIGIDDKGNPYVKSGRTDLDTGTASGGASSWPAIESKMRNKVELPYGTGSDTISVVVNPSDRVSVAQVKYFLSKAGSPAVHTDEQARELFKKSRDYADKDLQDVNDLAEAERFLSDRGVTRDDFDGTETAAYHDVAIEALREVDPSARSRVDATRSARLSEQERLMQLQAETYLMKLEEKVESDQKIRQLITEGRIEGNQALVKSIMKLLEPPEGVTMPVDQALDIAARVRRSATGR